MNHIITTLLPGHSLAYFDCGNPELNEWLRKHALRAERERTAITYAVIDEGDVIAYSSLAAQSVDRDAIGGGKLARNAPPQVPVILLARLAVDTRWQGNRIGQSLLQHAIATAHEAGRLVGLRAVVVDPTDAAAANFYLRPFPAQPNRLFYPL